MFLNRDPLPNMYVLSASGDRTLKTVPLAWVIRSRVAPMSLSSAIQNELREASGGLPVARIRTMEETIFAIDGRRGLQHAGADDFRVRCVAAGGDRDLRADGVLRGAADAGDWHPARA